MDCILSTDFAREQYFWKMYFIYVVQLHTNVLLEKAYQLLHTEITAYKFFF